MRGEQYQLNKGVGIRVLLRYLAIAVFTVIASPQLNKSPDTPAPTEIVRSQVQLVEELRVTTTPKKATAKPVVKPKPKPQQSFPNKGCEAYRAEVRKYDWNVNVALAIMKAESGCRTNAVGDNYVIGGIYAPSCGLMQIRTLKGRPTCTQLKNPATNIAWAYKLYRANGWYPWTVYKNGMYLRYL